MGEEFKAALEAEGLEMGEEAAKAAVKAFFKALPKLVLISENKYDDMLVPVIAIIEPKVMELLDNINPADNPAV